MEPTTWRLIGGAPFASELSYNKFQDNTDSTLARSDESFIKAHGKCKAFHKGGNLSCCTHICQHYKLYAQKCEKTNILMHHWAIPHDIWRVMEEEKEAEK